MFTYFIATWNILRKFWVFYDHLVHFVFIWYIFFGFGIMHQEKSGNPASGKKTRMAFSAENWSRKNWLTIHHF
jgi:hypothetical protein